MKAPALLLPLLVLAACGSDAEPASRWTSLADIHRPGLLPSHLEERIRTLRLRDAVSLRTGDGEAVLEYEIADEAWTGDGEGRWSTDLPPELFGLAQAGRGRLRLAGADVPRASVRWDAGRLTVGERSEAPEQAVFSAAVDEGVAMDGTNWVVADDVIGAGVPLLPDQHLGFELDLAAGSTLRFVPAVRGAAAGEVTTLQVRLDDELLREIELREGERPFVEIPLTKDKREAATLWFEATGSPHLTVMYRPIVGVGDIGTVAERPWSGGRPNLVLFVADTLRADCLAAFGGEPGLSPELDRLAAESRCFVNTRSTASWTLPGVASLLTGVYPPQHGVERSDQGLPARAATIAEVLRRRGYRTAAVTDSFFVSRRNGFSQGFEWFQEVPHGEWDLNRTLDAAQRLVRQDDGRPLFLFVHTYRVHKPYRSGADEDDAAYRELLADVKRVGEEQGVHAAGAAFLERAGELRDLYRAGARGLDAVAGPWLRELADSDLLANGALIVTSDHGEAFGEHGELWHKGPLWDEVVRVPLLIRGAAAPAGSDERNASLVDLVPTLAQLAGVPAPAGAGVSLLGPPHERPVYAFWTRDETRTEWIVVDGQRKLHVSPKEEITAAFDLAGDPGEAHDLGENAEATWPRALLERSLPEIRDLFESRSSALDVPIGADRHDAFADLGYADE